MCVLSHKSKAGILNDNNNIPKNTHNVQQAWHGGLSIEAFYGHVKHFFGIFFFALSKISHRLWYHSSYTRHFVVHSHVMLISSRWRTVERKLYQSVGVYQQIVHIRTKHCTGMKIKAVCAFVCYVYQLACDSGVALSLSQVRLCIHTYAFEKHTHSLTHRERAREIGVYKLFNVNRLTFSSRTTIANIIDLSFALPLLPPSCLYSFNHSYLPFLFGLAFDAQLLHITCMA